jgi:hypothetical protein
MNQEKALFVAGDMPFEVVQSRLICPIDQFLHKFLSQKPQRQREPDFVFIISLVLLWWRSFQMTTGRSQLFFSVFGRNPHESGESPPPLKALEELSPPLKP